MYYAFSKCLNPKAPLLNTHGARHPVGSPSVSLVSPPALLINPFYRCIDVDSMILKTCRRSLVSKGTCPHFGLHWRLSLVSIAHPYYGAKFLLLLMHSLTRLTFRIFCTVYFSFCFPGNMSVSVSTISPSSGALCPRPSCHLLLFGWILGAKYLIFFCR